MAAEKPPSPDLDELDLGLPEPPADIPDLSLPAPPPERANRPAAARPVVTRAAPAHPAAPPIVPARPAAARSGVVHPAATPPGSSRDDSTRPVAAADIALDLAPSQQRLASTPIAMGRAVFGDGLDDFTEDDGAPEIAVATAVKPAKERRPLPTGLTPDASALDVTAIDIDRAAGYGPPPAGWYLAPPYTWRVYQRRRTLSAEVAELAQALAAAEEERDQVLDDLVTTLWPKLEQDRRFDEVLEVARAADRQAVAAAEELASTNAAFGAERQRLDGERTLLEQERTRNLEVEQQREAEREQRERALERAEGRLQRVGIEQRNGRRLEEQAAQADSGIHLPPGHADRLAELAAQIPDLLAEVDRHRVAVKEAAALMKQAQADSLRTTRELRKLDAERRTLEDKSSSESSSRAASVGATQRARRTARADVGRALLRVDLGATLPESDLDRLRAHDDAVRGLARKHLCHAQGLGAFDRSAFATGRALLAGAVLLVVGLLVVLVVFLMSSSEHPGREAPGSEDNEPLHGNHLTRPSSLRVAAVRCPLRPFEGRTPTAMG
ncbi:MAG: hypothetical protein JW751_24500 [Polyangiaceae bacterium]|nr:hypothetical protein [Polyangiaceae bacterium]